MRQLVYTMFITNNRALFHVWGKENLVKYQKVSKYYENDCRYLVKRDTPEQVFLCEFCYVFDDTFFTEQLWKTAFDLF